MSPRTVEAPPLRRMIIPALFVGALFAVVIFRQPETPTAENQWSFGGSTMGTVYTVKLVPPAAGTVVMDDVRDAVARAIESVNESMSTWREDSELSRFNRHGVEPFEASVELFEVMAESARVARLSGGAFDVTIGPLVDAWGFGPTEVDGPPTTDTIDALLAVTGFDLLQLDPERRVLTKKHESLRCDLSAIAKGYAVDRAAERLIELGIGDFMVEIGGEVRTSGHNPEGMTWRIGIERPEVGRGAPWTAIELDGAAMATSGDYRNFYIRDGVRVSHTLDPRTGRPITHNLASVTVVDPSCMRADALATALNVLGPDDGRSLVEREKIAALFLQSSPDGGFEEWASEAWRERFANITTSERVVGGESE